jgi:DNA-binding NarL/FixJ family response regulator
VADTVLDGYMGRGQQLKPNSARDSLTQREIEVLKLIAEGYPNKKIAEVLTISPKTVEKHRASLMTKLDIHNAAGLAAYAVEQGLVSCKNS